ncbi:MAG TPA: hypothetical protein VGV38_10795 [Pyrinomonadaceae bacterium]|nr:hypothetical protein [Pyrinomonadaceae bacterium]
MKIKVGVMGSAGDTLPDELREAINAKAVALGGALAARGVVVLTGATTGLPHLVGRTAHEHGALHVGVSPAENAREHAEKYRLPHAGTDVLVFTGFGLKGRNVVLVRSSDVVLVVRGSMGALNEFTIAHDEGKVVGCLKGTGGAADEAERLMRALPKATSARVIFDDDPERLLDACLAALGRPGEREDARS